MILRLIIRNLVRSKMSNHIGSVRQIVSEEVEKQKMHGSSQSSKKNQNIVVHKAFSLGLNKLLLFVGGIIFLPFGSMVVLGTIIQMSKSKRSYTLVEDLAGLTLFGILPLCLGLFCFYKFFKRKNKAEAKQVPINSVSASAISVDSKSFSQVTSENYYK